MGEQGLREMKWEIEQLDQAIKGVSNKDTIGSPYFEACMAFLGDSLAKKLLFLLEGAPPQTIRIVCSAEDYDLLAVPFADALGRDGVKCAISCLWSIYDEPTEYIPAKSVLVGQAHRDGPDYVDALVTICSSLAEAATAADHFSRSTGSNGAACHVVLAPFITARARSEVLEQLNFRGSIQPAFLDLDTRLSSESDFDLLPVLRSHLRQVYGHDRVAFVPRDFGGPEPNYQNDYEPPRLEW